VEKKKSRSQLYEERVAAIKEQLWQGRAGTMEQGPSAFPLGSNNKENNQENNDNTKIKKGKHSFLTKKKQFKRDLLPPLTDYHSDDNLDSRPLSRVRSAPNSSYMPPHTPESDSMVMSAISKGRALRGGKEVSRPLSSTEINLFDSPFAHHVVDFGRISSPPKALSLSSPQSRSQSPSDNLRIRSKSELDSPQDQFI